MKKNLVNFDQEIREERLERGLDPCGTEDILSKETPGEGLKKVKREIQGRRQSFAVELYDKMFPKK